MTSSMTAKMYYYYTYANYGMGYFCCSKLAD